MASSFMQSANNAGKLWTGQHMSISTILYSSQYYWDMTYDPVTTYTIYIRVPVFKCYNSYI